MAPRNNEFLMSWSSLLADSNETGWQTIALSPIGPLSLRAGRRSPDNTEAVLIGFPSKTISAVDKFPEGKGFSVELANLEESNHQWLALTRKLTGNAELFASMSCDLVDALDDAIVNGADESKLMRVFIGRVTAWQEFMRKGTQYLSPEAEVGLIGEISVLLEIISTGIAQQSAIEWWVGPFDGIQDFKIEFGAIEVKSTLSTTGFPAKIGSLDQLDDSLTQPIFIAGVRLKQTNNGRSLTEIIDGLKSLVKGDAESEGLLAERLLAAGYFEIHSEHYHRKFEQFEIRVFEITNDFPRLTSGNVPLGVVKSTYEIDLDKASGKMVSIEEALKKLKVM